MAISYIEKGPWMHEYISEQGYKLWQDGLDWKSDNDAAVQAIIDSFDPLPYAKADKIASVKTEGAKRASSIYAFLESDPERAIDFYNFAEDIYLSISAGSREPLSGSLLQFKSIYDAGAAAIATINAETDWQIVVAYDEVNTPAWP